MRWLRFGGTKCCLVDETHQLPSFFLGWLFVGGEAALGEIVGDRVAVRAANLHRDGELLHDAHEFGFGDCGGQDGEVSKVIGDIGSLRWDSRRNVRRICWFLGYQWK